MKRIVTATVVDDRAGPCPTEILCIEGNSLLVRLGDGGTSSLLVAIPLCRTLPTYIKAENDWYKLQEGRDGLLQYAYEYRKPRKGVKFLEVPNPWLNTAGPTDREERSMIHDVLHKLVHLFYRMKRS